jgi:hypothetical protein
MREDGSEMSEPTYVNVKGVYYVHPDTAQKELDAAVTAARAEQNHECERRMNGLAEHYEATMSAAVAAARAEGRESISQMWDQESLVMPLALIEAREQAVQRISVLLTVELERIAAKTGVPVRSCLIDVGTVLDLIDDVGGSDE